MSGLSSQLSANLEDDITSPEKRMEPLRKAGLDNINRSYMGIPSRISSALASRGYGSSGDVGGSLYKAEYERGGAISDLEGKLAAMANGNRTNAMGLTSQFIGSQTGGTQTETTNPGWGGVIAGGLSGLTTLIGLNSLLKGGGGGSGGGGGGGGGYTPGGWYDSAPNGG